MILVAVVSFAAPAAAGAEGFSGVDAAVASPLESGFFPEPPPVWSPEPCTRVPMVI